MKMTATEVQNRMQTVREHEVYLRALCVLFEYELLLPTMDRLAELIQEKNNGESQNR